MTSANHSQAQPIKTVLSNGLTILYLQTQEDPISACHIFLPQGASHEKESQSGLTTLMWSLFSQGTKKRTARQLAEDIESIGSYIGAGAPHDYSEISCHSTSEYFLEALEIMAEALFDPVFTNEEVAKEKMALIAAIQAKKESIFTVTMEKLNEQIYGPHPYGRSVIGKEETVQKLTPQDLQECHKKLVVPNGAFLSITSDIPFEKMSLFLRGLFDQNKWPSLSYSLDGKLPNASIPLQQITLKNPTQFEQAYLIIGFLGTPFLSEDHVPLKVLNGILGGGMSARLFQEVREKQGLAYDVGAFYPSRKSTSVMVIHTGLQSPRMEEAKKSIALELEKIQKIKVSSTELAQIKNYLKGTYILDHQTNSQRAHYLGWWEIMGKDASYDRDYVKIIDSVSAEQIQTVAQKYFGQPSITIETHPESRLLLSPLRNDAN